jgi:hypothetical protein
LFLWFYCMSTDLQTHSDVLELEFRPVTNGVQHC